MAQFKVGDKVRVNDDTGVINEFHETGAVLTLDNGVGMFCSLSEISPINTITITATLTTDTIPTDMLKQLSAAGFLITIKAI